LRNRHLSGLDRLLHKAARLRGKRIGLVTNLAAVTRDLCWSLAALDSAGLTIRALFSPEHGLYGAEADATGVPSGHDRRRRIPIHSLYGQTEKPSPGMLQGLDLLIFDIPDIGSRFYTYIWTLSLVIEACGECSIPLIVLDRPNPIAGRLIEGPGVCPGYEAFEGRKSIPIRHGWTTGEFAQWYKETHSPKTDLTVEWASGWIRTE
jgi:uncharacterized protein YbbC (DUF1343 family)